MCVCTIDIFLDCVVLNLHKSYTHDLGRINVEKDLRTDGVMFLSSGGAAVSGRKIP